MSQPKTTLIRGGTVVLGDTVSQCDLLILGERISAVGDLSDLKADTTVEAGGLLVLPGMVDTHVHFNDVFMDTISVHDYYTGTLAAAYGGVTSVIDFSNQVPGGRLVDTLAKKFEEENGLSLVDWGVHPVITQPTPETLDEIPVMVSKGAPTIKCYMTYRDEGLMLEIDDLKKVISGLREVGGMLLVHAEDNDLLEENIHPMLTARFRKPIYHARSRPIEVENKAIRDCIQMVRETGGRLFIVHLASAKGAELVSAARSDGLDIIAETCTHYLVFTEEMMEREDGIKWICSPPLRDQSNQERLWAGIRDGRIAMVTSDDAAYQWEAKLYGVDSFEKCPNGIPGIEPRLNLLYSEGVAKGRISLQRFVELNASTPAKLFGLWPQKGNLMPGADADIVLFDPQAKWMMGQSSLHMATDYSAYEDIEISGKIMKVYSRGELIIDGEGCLAEKGRGRYLHRKLDLSVRASI
jgi:dihydropyrimidinase